MITVPPRRVGEDERVADALIHADSLSVTYSGSNGPLAAIRDVSLDIKEGEFVALLGPSGCGKTTLLQVVAGLVQPTGGSCKFSASIAASGPTALGMIPQRPALLPWASLVDNAVLPLNLMRIDWSPGIAERLETLLDLVKLKPFRDALPHELSGGMQMRAAILRALLPRPKLLLMDEPFAAIDEPTRLRLGLETRRLLRDDGCAALLVTHSVQEAALLADTILVMSHRPGRIVAQFRPDYGPAVRDEDLLDRPEFATTCRALRSRVEHA